MFMVRLVPNWKWFKLLEVKGSSLFLSCKYLHSCGFILKLVDADQNVSQYFWSYKFFKLISLERNELLLSNIISNRYINK